MLKEVGKTYHICPTYNGGRDWPQGAYNPRSNVMFMPLSNLCIDSTARTDRDAAPQFVYNTTNVGKFATGKDKVGRIDAISVETGKTAVELGDAGLELLADPGDRRRPPVQRLDGPLPARARCRQRPGPVADAASLASGRRRRHLFGQRPSIHRHRRAVAARSPPSAVGLTPEADTTSGSNAMYVFALPQ